MLSGRLTHIRRQTVGAQVRARLWPTFTSFSIHLKNACHYKNFIYKFVCFFLKAPFIHRGAVAIQCFRDLAHSALKFHAKPEQGPLQFPVHNNSTNKERRVVTGSRGDFSSLDLDCSGPAGTHWKAAHSLNVPKRRGCPKRGNFTYHIFPKNSRPAMNRAVTGCVCLNNSTFWLHTDRHRKMGVDMILTPFFFFLVSVFLTHFSLISSEKLSPNVC